MKLFLLTAALLVSSATASQAQMMASAGNSPSSSAEAASAATEWYSCSGTFTITSNNAKYSYSGLHLRKIDGQSFEIKGTSTDGAAPAMLLHVRTLNPDLILRPGMTYVSEGNLEAGETFSLSLHTGNSQPVYVSADEGCTLKIGSVRGGSVSGELNGKMMTPTGNAQPFNAQFNVIDARYGR